MLPLQYEDAGAARLPSWLTDKELEAFTDDERLLAERVYARLKQVRVPFFACLGAPQQRLLCGCRRARGAISA